MTIRIKAIVMVLAFVLSGSLLLKAQSSKAFVVTKNNKKLPADLISIDSRGVLTMKEGNVTKKLNPEDYKYARVPMPSEVKKAALEMKDKKFASAATAFQKLYDKYKDLGWGPFCAYMGAKALKAEGKKSGAISRLAVLTKIPEDPASVDTFFKAQKMLASLYAESSDFSNAERILTILLQSSDNSIAPFSNNLKGDILLKRGQRKDGILMYLRSATLYDKTNKKERPEALVKIIQMLREDKNNKALEFEKMLKEDYPGSKYLKNL